MHLFSLLRFWNVFDRGVRLFLCCLCLSAVFGVLVACSSDAADKKISTVTASPVARGEDAQEPLASLSALPPGSEERPLKPGESGTTYTPDGMPALLPSKGVSADQLFAEKISDDDKRMDRIENAIVDMKREFDAVKPAIIRLTAVESDMQDLITQLQTLTGAPPATPEGEVTLEAPPVEDVKKGDIVKPEAVKAEAAEEAEEAPAAETKPASAAGAAAVKSIRSGSQDGAVRLVLDLSGNAAYKRDLDNGEHVLTIDLADTAWTAPASGTFQKTGLLKSWSVKKTDTGVIAAIQLSGAATIAAEMTLPGKDGAGKRLVFDLKPQ